MLSPGLERPEHLPPPPAPPCSRKHIGRIRVSHTRLHQGNLRLDGVEKAHTFYHHTQLGVGGGGGREE